MKSNNENTFKCYPEESILPLKNIKPHEKNVVLNLV